MSRPVAIQYRSSKSQAPAEAVELCIGNTLNKSQILTALGEACQFPDYYNRKSWDAAWDCLQDSEVKHLLLDLHGVTQLDKAALKELISLIIDAYDAWQQPQLWIIQETDKAEKPEKKG